MVPSQWKKASGRKQVKKGFAFTPEHDELFALGWPHLRLLYDHNGDPERHALGLLRDLDFSLTIQWPRNVACAIFRAFSQGQLFRMGPATRDFRSAALRSMTNLHEPDQDDIEKALALRFKFTPMWSNERGTESFILLAEALSETAWVAEAIVNQLEELDFDQLHDNQAHPALITYQLGYLLLRLPKKQADAVRARLTHILEGNGAIRPGTDVRIPRHPCHVRSISLVLNPKEAADRYTDKDVRWYTHATAEPRTVLMRSTINHNYSLPDVRLLWIGGDKLLSTRLFQRWDMLHGPDRRWFFEQVAPVASPEVTHLMVDLWNRGENVANAAKAWVIEHADHTRPTLEDLAASNSGAAHLLGCVR